VPEPVKPRPYRSARRREQAAGTRLAVLRAARELFTTRGYADTGVAEVAGLAGVSVDTVYASVGRKPRLLLAVHDMELAGGDAPLPAEQRDYVRAIREAQGARRKLEVYAEALGRLLPRTVPLAEALRVAGQTDAACRRTWEELTARRAANMRLLAADLRSTGELRGDLTDEEVADLVWSMNSPEYFRLVTSRGRDYAAWVTDVWTRTLLA
jgi:AcrR family transcriptional regulator